MVSNLVCRGVADSPAHCPQQIDKSRSVLRGVNGTEVNPVWFRVSTKSAQCLLGTFHQREVIHCAGGIREQFSGCWEGIISQDINCVLLVRGRDGTATDDQRAIRTLRGKLDLDWILGKGRFKRLDGFAFDYADPVGMVG